MMQAATSSMIEKLHHPHVVIPAYALSSPVVDTFRHGPSNSADILSFRYSPRRVVVSQCPPCGSRQLDQNSIVDKGSGEKQLGSLGRGGAGGEREGGGGVKIIL
jgi:hypothetical protein